MIRIVSANLNGIRSAATKGFFEWLAGIDADIVCVQELKAQETDLTDVHRRPGELQGWFHPAEKKGYSGVGIYARHAPLRVQKGFGVAEFDAEGRYLELEFDHTIVISLYLPSGSSSDERQQAKFRFLEVFPPHLARLAQGGKAVVLCGDWNIAHREQDLKNWKSNQNNSGFLPEERAWLTEVLHPENWLDVYRALHPETTDECYTWWSNRGQAYAKNVGWRIDYQIASPALAHAAQRAEIYKTRKFSDHAPLIIDYDWTV
ncbi:MAG: exodeoxyribonuclease III [Burkholderiaceae bacterium]|jgi:exodeoxyribonuclease-3